jgi:hypothetical protein
MRSPFAIFRKHQRVAMVILTALSMFAFVVMDQLRAESPMTLPILAAAVGMMLFGYFGYQRGEPVTWGVAGGALGVAIALVAMRFGPSGPKPPVQTAMGDISREELNNLVTRRNNANNFLQQAYEKVSPPPRGENEFLLNYYEQQLRNVLFGFGLDRQGDISDDVVMGFLLDKEADDLGLSVSDGAVSDYINHVTGNKLSPKEYANILKSVHLTEGQLFDAVRAELRAKLAMEMLMPRASATPEQFWDDYRKLQVTESLDVAAVPVSDFLAEAPQPTEQQMLDYYNQKKMIPAPSEGAPGLYQPRRARIEYLEADYNDLEKQSSAKPVTDVEVKKYYDDHHEEFRTRPAAGSSTLDSLMQNPAGLTTPDLTVPEAPTLPAPVLPNTPAAKAPTAPSMPPGAPAKSPAATEKKSAPGPAAPALPNPSSKAGKDASKSGARDDRPARLGRHDGEMLALADEPSGRSRLFADREQLASAEKTGSKPDTAKSAGKNGANAKASSPAATKASPTQAALQDPREPSPPALPRTGGAGKTGPGPEFRPLDDELRKEIRQTIVRNRTVELMKSKTEAGADYLNKLRELVVPAEVNGEPKMNAEQRAKALAEYAAKNGLKYGITPLLSPQELFSASEKYPIGAAEEPMNDPFQRRRPVSVLQEIYGRPQEYLYQVAQADDHDIHRYAFWKVEDVAQHAPTLDEPGIREQVIRGWQIENSAQKQADTRAKELADLVRKSNKPMAEALAGQTVTKQPKGPPVVVIPTPPFSWYTVKSAPQQGLMPDSTPQISDVVGVKEAGDPFMKTVFDEMKVGDVKAVPNFPSTIYYVVKVKSRHPENAEEMAAFRARFMKENFYGSFLGRSTYEHLNLPIQQKLVSDWADRLFAKYSVKRNMDEEPVRQTRSRRNG